MTDIQVEISNNNKPVEIAFAQSIAASLSVHNNNEDVHANIVSELKNELESKIAVKADSLSIPTKVSQLSNDNNFATVSQLPVFPTNVSAFANDLNYVTSTAMAGVLADKTDKALSNITQTAALTNLGFAGQLLAANGYYKLPNGLILQWGSFYQLMAWATMTITLPIPFLTVCLYAGATDGGSGRVSYGVTSSPSQIIIYSDNVAGRGGKWFAIGY